MKVRAPSRDSRYFDVKKLIHGQSLHTICEEARCPNIWQGTNKQKKHSPPECG